MSEPAKHLNCKGFSITKTLEGAVAFYVFDDGSAWIHKTGNEWECFWQPEPVVIAWADPTVKPTEARPAEETIEFKANPKPFVMTPDLTIRSIEDIQRIAALETELRIMKERFEAVKAHAEDVGDRCKRAQERANAWARAANKGSQASITSPECLETRIEIYEEQLEELKKPQPAATPDRPKTITVDELRVGDEMHLFGELRRIESIGSTGRYSISGVKTVSMRYELVDLLARGVQVYRDGKLISGWPVESPPDDFNWRDLYKSAEADVKKHEARIAELEAEIAVIKSQPQEADKDPILSMQRVYATMLYILSDMKMQSAYGTYRVGLVQVAITVLESLFGHVTPNNCPSYRVK